MLDWLYQKFLRIETLYDTFASLRLGVRCSLNDTTRQDLLELGQRTVFAKQTCRGGLRGEMLEPVCCKKQQKQARKGFRPPSAMKGIGYFQNLGNLLRNFLEIFWIFWGIIWKFFRRIFFGGIHLEEFFGRIFLGGFFGRIFWEGNL